MLQFLQGRPRMSLLLALFAGALLVTAFAPFEVRSASILAPAILFVLLASASPWQAAVRGYVFGVGMFAAGVYWIFHSLHLFGEAIAPLAMAITAGFVLFLALFPAVMGYLISRLGAAMPLAVRLLLLMPALWLLFEWLRSVFLTGFPWLLLGTAHLDTALSGFVPILGVAGASLVAAFMAACLALAMVRGQRVVIAAGILLLMVWGAGLMLNQLQWTRATERTLSVSLLQGNVSQDEKMQFENLPRSMERYAELTLQAIGAELILWPETAIPTFYDYLADDLLLPLARAVQAAGGELVIGVFTHEPETERMFNSIVRVDEHEPAFYHKRRLVPFGEYLPLRGVLAWLDGYIELPMADLSRGDGAYTLALGDLILGPSVCYEDAFGRQVIRALPEAGLLVNVSNDAWFGDSIAPHQHLEIARARALESGRYMLRATNTGISAIIDHRGLVLARSPQFQPHVLSGTVQIREGTTPYVRWGDWPVLLFAIAMLLCAVLIGRYGRAVQARP